MEGKNLVLFVFVALAALFLISTFSDSPQLTGRAADRGINSCSDTDAFNIHNNGVVTVTSGGTVKDYVDRCSGGDGLRVLENYCEGDRRAFTYEWCDTGWKCSDGRCVKDTLSNFY